MSIKQKKVKKPFYKRWWFIVCVVFIAIRAIGSSSSSKKQETLIDTLATSETTTKTTDDEIVSTEEAITETVEEVTPASLYKNGKYLVGTDIEDGLYKVTLNSSSMKMGYIERSKDLKMEPDSILANIILTGDGYVEILPTDVAVKLQGVTIKKISLDDLTPNFKSEVEGGIYLVGYDLKPGTYKAEVTDTVTQMGYVERSNSVAMNMSDIIANEIIQGQSYIEILESDFAVRVQGVKLILHE